LPPTIFNDRLATVIENDCLRVTVLQQGGHIAEIFDKQAQISPLWIPPWQSIEPSTYDTARHSEFGTGSDSKLLAGIMGHNLCLDIFGGPSTQEAEAGITAHGEASVDPYQITETDQELVMRLHLKLAQLLFERRIQLRGGRVRIKECVENLAAFDRPIAWTQHVTLGPPFLDPKTTQFQASVTRSMVSETDPGLDAYLKKGTVFDWPEAPRSRGGTADLRQMSGATPASGYTTHLADPQREHAFFMAYTQKFRFAFGYVWKSKDFPWLGIWEENCSRQHSPWNGRAVTRGMEFGVSPIPESRREMVERGLLFGTPTYRWLPAKATLETEYWVLTQNADCMPESFTWPRDSDSNPEH
jgi:hypothetical protein